MVNALAICSGFLIVTCTVIPLVRYVAVHLGLVGRPYERILDEYELDLGSVGSEAVTSRHPAERMDDHAKERVLAVPAAVFG
jgi:hypothetical protein